MSEPTISAADVRAWLADYAAVIAEHRAELVALDTAIGDGDHGTNMDRGMRAAIEKLDATDGDDIGALLKAVAMALISKVGGAAGPLYGTLFLQMGNKAAGRDGARSRRLDGGAAGRRRWRHGARQGRPGDKTMVDALVPAVEALRDGDGDSALRRSADAAEEGMRATTPLEARKGRASYLGPRSVGHQDPGRRRHTCWCGPPRRVSVHRRP